MTDREAFEAWWIPLSDGFEVELEKTAAGAYLNVYTAIAWSGWQASRRQMAEEAMRACNERAAAYDILVNAQAVMGCDDCLSAIRSLATPTEGKT